MKYSEKITFKSDQLNYDLKMKNRHNWWWLLLLLLIPLLLWLLSRCDGIIPSPPIEEEDSTTVVIDSTIFEHPVQVMLSWHNYDDLDLHVCEPNGYEIYYSDNTDSETLGHLNFDRNVSSLSRHPQEHISWPKISKMVPGEYLVLVRNYTERSSINDDYQIDIVSDQIVYRFRLNEKIGEKEKVPIVKFSWNRESGITILQSKVEPQSLTRSEAGF